MIDQLKKKLATYGFSIDPYYSFFLQYGLEKQLEKQVLFENEGLDFKFSSVAIPWKRLDRNLVFSGVKWSSNSDFFNKFNIDPKDESIIVEEIYSLDKIIKLFDSVFIHDPNFKDGLMQIAVIEKPVHSRLLCSLRDLDFGNIWMELPEEIFRIKLSQNIILLLNEANILIQDENIKRFDSSLDAIYKRWGEDFWRVREE